MVLRSLLLCVLALAAAARADFQGATHMVPFDEDAIAYSRTAAEGPAGRLQKLLQDGKVRLTNDAERGYLPALLAALKVPISSQMLVFSRTSFQRERITPKTPRSLFFNDNVYVGFIPGSPLIEISEAEPRLGGVFYTLEQRAPNGPRLTRNDQCLECHASAKTMGVPGHLVRSFLTDEDGVVDLSTGISQVNHRTPIEERWGGWYVTGTLGGQKHRGNLFAGAGGTNKQATGDESITNLSSFFETSRYPSPGSDVVALMVLEHQTHMHNFITRLRFEGTMALQQYGHVKYLTSIVEAFVKYLLFVEEAPLAAKIEGTSGFTLEFSKLGPFDRHGRSLRQFELKTRLFEYPCSYLIYSEAFDALPSPIRDRVYARLWEILSGRETSKDYEKLTPEIRRALLEILADTKKDLPACWEVTPRTAASQTEERRL